MEDKKDNSTHTSNMKPIRGLATLEIYRYIEQYKSKIVEAQKNNEELLEIKELDENYRRLIDIQEAVVVAKMNLLIDLFKEKTTSEQTIIFLFEDVRKDFSKLEEFQTKAMEKINSDNEKEKNNELKKMQRENMIQNELRNRMK